MRISRTTPLGFPAGHFYSPIPDFDDVRRRYGKLFGPSPRTLPGIDLREAEQLSLLEPFAGYHRDQPFQEARGPRRYGFQNEAFGPGDALTLHFLMRHLGPRRIVEVGSGWSSGVMLDTDELFLGGKTHLTFIEPYPDALHTVARPEDLRRARLIETKVQDAPMEVFSALESGDILFIDSTHVSKIGSDVNFLFFEVLPSLRPGVFVHVHDIAYPFEYPQEWVLGEGRAWNEAYLLRAFLQFNPAFEIVFWGSFLAQFHRERLLQLLPTWSRNAGASIWLRRVGK
jgi:predicted O-methyltransferase YrrM